MKKVVWFGAIAVCALFALVAVSQVGAQEKMEKQGKMGKMEKKGMMGKMESFSGKVTAVDPKAIVVESGQGKGALTVGAIVTPDTVLMVKGKKMSIDDLAKEVKPGDMVKLKIERTTDLYAKEISK